MKKITLQGIFDAAWQAFVVEGKPPAVIYNGVTCAYLTEDGRKCAIGLVLPDGHPAQYSTHVVDELIKDYPELWDDTIIDDNEKNIVSNVRGLQKHLHDGLINARGQWRPGVDLREEYLQTAIDFDLTVPE